MSVEQLMVARAEDLVRQCEVNSRLAKSTFSLIFLGQKKRTKHILCRKLEVVTELQYYLPVRD